MYRLSPSQYVDITKAQFERGLYIIRDNLKNSIGYIQVTVPNQTSEYVYILNTKNPEIKIKVFSSVHVNTGTTRNKGLDAIRIVPFYQNREIYFKTPHTKRMKNWQTNLQKKIEEVLNDIESIPHCPKCHCLMVQRKGKNGLFWGCYDYPNCKGTLSCNQK